MPHILRLPGAPRVALAGLALCLASSAALVMTAAPGYGYPAARPAKVWRGHSAQIRAFPARPFVAKVAKPVAKAKPADPKATGAVDAKAAEKPASSEPSSSPSSAWTSGEGERACFTSRRKLWQDGEGWVVKKVSVCP